jgi:hypothetical protein
MEVVSHTEIVILESVFSVPRGISVPVGDGFNPFEKCPRGIYIGREGHTERPEHDEKLCGG